MRDPESRNAIAVAPSSALQTHTNASWHLSSPGKRTARAAGSGQQQFLAAEEDSGPWLGFEVWDGCSHAA